MAEHIIPEADQLDEASVLADSLLAEGDPRGELLALEVASVRASSVEEARALNERATSLLWDSPRQFWPSSFAPATARLRAGFVVEFAAGSVGQLKDAAPLLAMRGLRKLSGWRMDELEHCYRSVNPAWVTTTVNPTTPDWDDLGVLVKLQRLRQLDLELSYRGPAHDEALAQLVELEELSALSLKVHDLAAIERLAQLQLTHLQLARACNEQHFAALEHLTQLRHLELDGRGVRDAASAAMLSKLGLDSLGVRVDIDPRLWGEASAQLGLRRLRVGIGFETQERHPEPRLWHEAHARLATQLESFEVDAAFVDANDLFDWPKLRRLTLNGFAPIERLPRLEQLSLSMATLGRLRALPSPSLTVFGRSDDTLDWTHLLAIQRDLALRELQLFAPLDASLPADALRALERLEHLTLAAPLNSAQVEQLKELPCLRRLTIRSMSVGHHRELAETLREVLVETTPHWPRNHRLD